MTFTTRQKQIAAGSALAILIIIVMVMCGK